VLLGLAGAFQVFVAGGAAIGLFFNTAYTAKSAIAFRFLAKEPALFTWAGIISTGVVMGRRASVCGLAS
jgi:hypothetical protein